MDYDDLFPGLPTRKKLLLVRWKQKEKEAIFMEALWDDALKYIRPQGNPTELVTLRERNDLQQQYPGCPPSTLILELGDGTSIIGPDFHDIQNTCASFGYDAYQVDQKSAKLAEKIERYKNYIAIDELRIIAMSLGCL